MDRPIERPVVESDHAVGPGPVELRPLHGPQPLPHREVLDHVGRGAERLVGRVQRVVQVERRGLVGHSSMFS